MRPPTSEGAWLNAFAMVGRGVGVEWEVPPTTLRGRRVGWAFCTPFIPPYPWPSIVEAGRETLGVLDGVTLGVELLLLTPTRDFLEDERGVMLLLRKALTGVWSSGGAVFARGVLPTLLRGVRVG